MYNIIGDNMKYKKDAEFSYTLGITLTIELLKTMPKQVERVYFHSDFDGNAKEIISNLCENNNIDVVYSNKIFHILSDKDNCFCIGEFRKFTKAIEKDANHLVLVNPADAGNMGTILRSALGFGVTNICIVKPAVDVFNPKVVRASMGAIFHLNIKYYDDFKTYQNEFTEHALYPFMLKAQIVLNEMTEPLKTPYSLIFGNEATGLPDEFLGFGDAIIIKHSNLIDSLNLPTAVGIGLYEATKKH